MLALKGNIFYCASPAELVFRERSHLLIENGLVAGISQKAPENARVLDYGDRLILPGMADLHLHASQFANMGLGMDLELLEWLSRLTYPEEERFAGLDYAERLYAGFAKAVKFSATTRLCAFATIHSPATDALMRLLDAAGLRGYVGRVGIDRGASPALTEDTGRSLADTEAWLCETADKYENIKPILTPRFAPACSEGLLRGLAELSKKYRVPVQSHLSENFGEIALVKELFPKSRFYGEVYDSAGLFGGEAPTIMAHCVHSSPGERELLRKNGVFIAHCPTSNENIASGIAPVREYLEAGCNIGLGSDISGGHTLSMLRVAVAALNNSKTRWRLVDDTKRPLTLTEALWLATAGGGSFFGRVGKFEKGYEADAVVIDPDAFARTPFEALQKAVYLAGDSEITAKYVAGKVIFDRLTL